MTSKEDRQPLGEPEQVSAYLGIPEPTLRMWRSRGKGPRYLRVGRHVRYRWTDVEAWLDEQAREPEAVA